jgi:hypothetical protein
MKIYPKDLMLNGGVTMASLLGSHPPLLPFLLLWDSTSGKANVFCKSLVMHFLVAIILV